LEERKWAVVIACALACITLSSTEECIANCAMSELSAEEIWQAIGEITSTFSLLECDKCAIAIMQWLNQHGVSGTVLKLKTKRRSEVFITSDRWNSDESITENGTHYGVEVLGQVFDNLSSEGLPRKAWLQSFHCPSNQFILEELEFL
jgi:hypothetical protein